MLGSILYRLVPKMRYFSIDDDCINKYLVIEKMFHQLEIIVFKTCQNIKVVEITKAMLLITKA